MTKDQQAVFEVLETLDYMENRKTGGEYNIISVYDDEGENGKPAIHAFLCDKNTGDECGVDFYTLADLSDWKLMKLVEVEL